MEKDLADMTASGRLLRSSCAELMLRRPKEEVDRRIVKFDEKDRLG